MLQHAEIVGAEQIAEPELLLQILQQVDDLRLDRQSSAETSSSQISSLGSFWSLLPLATGRSNSRCLLVAGGLGGGSVDEQFAMSPSRSVSTRPGTPGSERSASRNGFRLEGRKPEY